MAACTLYKNTGFTPTNLPYDEASLEAAAANKTETAALDLIQIYGLAEISVKQFEDGVMDCDYVKISNNGASAFYAVTGYAMTSMDVARLALAADPGLTCGGWDKINIGAGTWTRSPDDTQNALVIDGMLQISDMPRYLYRGLTISESGVDPDNDYQFVASTVRLEDVPTETDKVAYTYDDETGEVSYAFVPKPVGEADRENNGYTKIIMQIDPALTSEYGGGEVQNLSCLTNGYAIYDFGQDSVKQAVATLRAYGYESAIIGAWRVPASFIVPISLNDDPVDGYNYTKKYSTGRYIQIATTPSGANYSNSPMFDPSKLYASGNETAKDIADIIKHSDAYRVGLLSVPTGAKIEKSRPQVTGGIYGLVDPRMNGGPYYILQDVAPVPIEEWGDPVAYVAGELQKCAVQGATWDAIPIIYEGASGRVQNYMKLYQKENFANENYQANLENVALTGMAGMFSALPGVDITLPQSYGPGDPESGMMEWGSTPGSFNVGMPNAGRAAGSLMAAMIAADSLTRARLQDAKTSMAQYVISNKLVAPQITSQTIEGIQQYFGNYAVIYATYPSELDVLRFGVIAAMFGLACNRPADSTIKKPVTAAFYQGSGIQVTTLQRVPNAVRKDIADLLNIGVRLWSTKPRRLTATDWKNRNGGD